MDEAFSPALLEKVSYLGTLLKSFRQGDVAIEKLLDISLGHKRLEAAATPARASARASRSLQDRAEAWTNLSWH